MLYPPPTSIHPPLYILGGGSIGLLFSCSMMRVATATAATTAVTVAATTPTVKLLPRLLFRSHHLPYFQHYRRLPSPSPSTSPSPSPLLPKPQPPQSTTSSATVSHPKTDHNIPSSYILASLRNGYNNNEQTKPPKTVTDDKKIDIPTCVITTTTTPSRKILRDPQSQPPYIQNLLLTTKGPDATTAIQSILHRFHPTKPVNIVIMTNGVLAVTEEVGQILTLNGFDVFIDGCHTYSSVDGKDDGRTRTPRVNLITASTTHGAYREKNDDGHNSNNGLLESNNGGYNVVHAGIGRTYLHHSPSSSSSDDDGFVPMLTRTWSDVGLRAEILSTKDMEIMNWKKLAANCAINPLTALRGCTNGELELGSSSKSGGGGTIEEGMLLHYNDPDIIYRIIHEVSSVAIAELRRKHTDRITTTDQNNNNNNNNNDDDWIREQLSRHELTSFVENVIRSTSNNTSSMRQDFLAGRYPTEIRYLNGYVARIGRERYGMDMAANRMVTEEVERVSSLVYYNASG